MSLEKDDIGENYLLPAVAATPIQNYTMSKNTKNIECIDFIKNKKERLAR